MVRQLEVYLDGQHCGTLSQTSTGNSGFTYENAYRIHPGATPLSLSIPLSAVSHRKRTVLPFFQGLLPDNSLALEAIARRFEVSARNPFALLEHVGSDVAGALQVLPPGVLPTDGSQRKDQGQPIDSAGVAQMLRAAVDQYQTGSGATGSLGRFSLAGAQPKIALRRDGNQWSVPLGGAASTHILKPVTGALPTIDVVEYLTMRAAGLVGLSVAQSALSTIEGVQVLISTRYDRRQEGNRVTRLHQEDLCQALAVSPERKYQHQDGGPGVGAIAALVRSLPSREDQESVARHFFEALVFNTLAACTDAHAKNYSLLLEGPSVRLAPLYDLASALGYWDGESRLNLAMSIGGHYALNHITLSDLVREGSRLGLEDAEGIVEHIRGQIIPAFDAAREELVSLRPDAQVLADRLMGALAGLPLLATDR